jgi:hypothetical protein
MNWYPTIPIGARVQYDKGPALPEDWTGTVVAHQTENREYPLLVHWDNDVKESCCVAELKVLTVPSLKDELDELGGAECSC